MVASIILFYKNAQLQQRKKYKRETEQRNKTKKKSRNEELEEVR